MSLTPSEQRTLTELADELAAANPRLGRRLSRPMQAPESAWRELAVIAVMLAWMSAGFTPMALGVAWTLPVLIYVGAFTAFVAAPMGMWASLRWVDRHRFVRFRNGDLP